MILIETITKDPQEWSKETWQGAYAEYCKTQPWGPKTKREYYDMVMANFKKLAAQQKPLSDELSEQWLKGWRAAVAYARQHKCDINGRELCADQQRNTDALLVAKDAKEIAVDTAQKLEYLINVAKKRRVTNE